MDAFFEMVTTFLDVAGSGRSVSLLDLMPAEMDPYTVILIAALTIIIGVLQCFLGFKSFKVWCSFIGLILGAVLGVIFVMSLSLYEQAYSEIISIFFIVCLGLVGAFAAYRLYLAGVFVYAFAVLFVLSYFPLSSVVNPNIIAVIIGICIGVAAGVIAVIMQRVAIITSTSLSGAIAVATGMMMLFEGANPFLEVGLPIIVAVMCAVGGFFVQLATTKKKQEPMQPVPVVVVPPVQGVVYPVQAGGAVPPAGQPPAVSPAPEATPAPPPPAPAPEAPPAGGESSTTETVDT